MKKFFIIIIIGLIIFSLFFLKKKFKKTSNFEPSEKIFLGLINASGDRLATNLFVKYLQKANFLVSYVIEINDTFEKTIVIEHIDKNLKNGKAIQRYLEYKNKEPKKFLFWKITRPIFFKKNCPSVYLFLDSSLNLSASIILGKDYQEIIKNE
ncbi:MAG: hypothetical protein N2323_04995 [candidate division WOR-3 bacterium]|nr:hypothetical protein [candidate division WOR-3 bacterium]MCX7837297.1 hypothetical protein [candidate division WOR-3 bacterium]